MKKIIASVLVLGAIAGIAFGLNQWNNNRKLGGGDGFSAYSCTPTHTVATIGHQLSSTLLSANSRRAWARVSQPLNATNTVSVSFGGTAVSGQGEWFLATSSSVTFGLNTDLPFTGAVAGITSTGSTTVNVTQCVYNR